MSLADRWDEDSPYAKEYERPSPGWALRALNARSLPRVTLSWCPPDFAGPVSSDAVAALCDASLKSIAPFVQIEHREGDHLRLQGDVYRVVRPIPGIAIPVGSLLLVTERTAT